VRLALAGRHLRASEGYLDQAEEALDDKVRSALWRLSMKEQLLAMEYWPVEHPGQVPLPGEKWGEDEDEEEHLIECVICGGPAPAPTRSNPIEGLYCERCA
jgi:hypothetical protein